MKSSRFSTLCSVAKSYRIAENVRSEIYTKMKITSITISSTAPVTWIQMCFIIRTWCLALKQIHNETQETMPPQCSRKKWHRPSKAWASVVSVKTIHFTTWTNDFNELVLDFLSYFSSTTNLPENKIQLLKNFWILWINIGTRVTRKEFSVLWKESH